jgi:hypothetical protein
MENFAIKSNRETLIGRYVMCPIHHIENPGSKYCNHESKSPKPKCRYKYHPGWIIAVVADIRDGSMVAYIEHESGKISTSRLDELVFDDENHSRYLSHVRMEDLMWQEDQIAKGWPAQDPSNV